jgi:hypothetical protein
VVSVLLTGAAVGVDMNHAQNLLLRCFRSVVFVGLLLNNLIGHLKKIQIFVDVPDFLFILLDCLHHS